MFGIGFCDRCMLEVSADEKYLRNGKDIVCEYCSIPDKLSEIREYLSDLKEIPNDCNSMSVTATSYIEDVELLLQLLDKEKEGSGCDYEC